MTPLPLWLLSCSTEPDPQIVAAFDQARSEALAAVPLAADKAFTPDLVLHLSPPVVTELVSAGLQAAPRMTDQRVIAGVTLTTVLDIEEVTLKRSPRVEGFAATTRLLGTLTYDGGILGKGSVPISVDALLDVAVDTEVSAERFRVLADPLSVVQLTPKAEGVPKRVMGWIQEPLRELVQAELTAMPPSVVFVWQRQGLPLRGFRVEPEGAGIRVAMLSTAVHPGEISGEQPRPAGGFRLDASMESVLWLARTEAFSREPLRLDPKDALASTDGSSWASWFATEPYELVPVPESLVIQDDAFQLGVRLWRLQGPSWWRDYAATGKITVEDRKLGLSIQGVSPGATSPGAGLVDPLAALAQSVLLSSLTEPLQHFLPGEGSMKAQGREIAVELGEVRGKNGILRVHGSLEVK